MTYKINLRLFGEGGAGAGAGDAGSSSGASAAQTATASAAINPQTGESISDGNTRRQKRSGEFRNVIFGKQPSAGDTTPAAEGQSSDVSATPNAPTSNTLEERKKAFRDLISGEYKDLYTEETQRLINTRFKETKGLQDTVSRQQPIIDMLMERYKVGDGDVAKLQSAIENDSAYWSEAAEEAGMTEEQYREFSKLQRENKALIAERERQKQDNFAQDQAQKWYSEAQELKGKFPNFDFRAELENPEFVRMLKAGTPVEHAYKVLHFDELMSDAVGRTAAQTQKNVVDHIRANGMRPAENAQIVQSAFTVSDDVRKLTKEQRAEIAKRVKSGADIKF